jgi:threonine/homoserine/homoserine lactone efflux protein
MNLLDFAIEVIGLSASAVLAPGPLFFANLTYGTRLDRWSGVKVAYGHTVVELPLIIILAIGLFTFDVAKKYAGIIGFVGGIAMLAFASLQIASIINKERVYNVSHTTGSKGPFVIGVALTALNPFFVFWWLTAGLKLIADSGSFGLITGLVMLFVLHIWMDYAWLGCTAYLASMGDFFIKSKYYSVLRLGLAAAMVYYGISFLLQAVSSNIQL